jgi:hypothetical protein
MSRGQSFCDPVTRPVDESTIGLARNVMRAGLWPILAAARLAENPAAASFSTMAASP